MWADDPRFDEFQAEIERYRQEVDAQVVFPWLPTQAVDLSHLKPDSTLAHLPTHHFEVHPNTSGGDVAAHFEQNPELPGVIITERGKLWV